MEDVTRIVQKFVLGKGDTDDLLAIRDTINVWKKIQETIQLELAVQKQPVVASATAGDIGALQVLLEKFLDLNKLAEKIDAAVDETEERKKERNDIAEGLSDVNDVDFRLASLDAAESAPSKAWTINPQ